MVQKNERLFMYKIEEIEKRFSDENANLFQYTLHSIISFARYKEMIILGITDDKEIKGLLEQFESCL